VVPFEVRREGRKEGGREGAREGGRINNSVVKQFTHASPLLPSLLLRVMPPIGKPCWTSLNIMSLISWDTKEKEACSLI